MLVQLNNETGKSMSKLSTFFILVIICEYLYAKKHHPKYNNHPLVNPCIF